MQRIDFQFEEQQISEPVGLLLEGFNFIVCPFQWASGNRIIEKVQQSDFMRS